MATVLITTTLQGAAPEEVETEITDKIEGAVNTISDIDELRSSSNEGVSLVTLNFGLDKNIDVGTQEVRDHINGILTSLPKGIDPAGRGKEIDPDAAPIMLITLRAKGTQRDLTELADKRVRRQIESINGVGQVTILGGRKRQINLWLDPVKLAASGITAFDVERSLASQNISIPGGEINTGPRRISPAHRRARQKCRIAFKPDRHRRQDHATRVIARSRWQPRKFQRITGCSYIVKLVSVPVPTRSVTVSRRSRRPTQARPCVSFGNSQSIRLGRYRNTAGLLRGLHRLLS